jgi:uncharacterized protein (TIGR02145 family)
MTQNLRSTYTLQGNVRQAITADKNKLKDNNAIAYYYPSVSETTFNTHPEYGLLYTWGAANIGTATTEVVNAFQGRSSDRQGICPDGWVIPNKYDFNQLEKEIATHPDLYSTQTTPFTWNNNYENMSGWRPDEGNTVQTWWGRSMKSPTAVTTTVTNGVSNTDGTGFNALIVGYLTKGISADYSTSAVFWSSSVSSATIAWYLGLYRGYSGVIQSTSSKSTMYSVRCKK